MKYDLVNISLTSALTPSGALNRWGWSTVDRDTSYCVPIMSYENFVPPPLTLRKFWMSNSKCLYRYPLNKHGTDS